jgi:hypothetical protein
VQIAAGTYPLSTPGNPLESTDYLNEDGKKINPVLWAIKQLQKSGVTVVRFFGGGVTTDFQMIKTPGTAGANGKTWPNGTCCSHCWRHAPAPHPSHLSATGWAVVRKCSQNAVLSGSQAR